MSLETLANIAAAFMCASISQAIHLIAVPETEDGLAKAIGRARPSLLP